MFGGSERAVAVVIQPCVPVLVIGSLHADTMLDCTESSSPGETSTRWRPAVLAGLQVVMLLTAATLGVFKGSA